MKPRLTAQESGFTVIELMVAIAIGLIITLVVTQAYLSGLGTQRAQTDISRAQEASRFGFDLLAQSIRKAGYKNPTATGIGYCTSSPTGRIAMTNDPASVTLGSTTYTILNSSDILRVNYFGEGAGTGDGSIVDCLGNTVAANTQVQDVFFVAADANNDNEPALFCFAGASATAQPLVPGIESLQLLFGDDTDSDGTVNRYVTATNVSNANNVRNIVISVVARTKETSAIDNSARTFSHFGQRYAGTTPTAPTGDSGSVFTSPADGRTRQQFSTTIALRNLCPI
nr:PilW family protein [Dechloromonas sp.]